MLSRIQISTQPGGGVVNSSASLVGLGEAVALLASTGQDIWAEMVLGPLEKIGVDLSRVVSFAKRDDWFDLLADCRRGANHVFLPWCK